MSDRYNYGYGAQSGASYLPASTNDRHENAQDASSAPVNDNKPYALSPGQGFESSRGTKECSDEVPSTTKSCASPDGSFQQQTTVGQDKPGKDHPFMIKTSRSTTSNGSTVINRSEFHWAITPSKDGKTRFVDYKMTLDRQVYDRYGGEISSSHQPFQGTFKNDGQALPFEQPLHCEGSCDETRPGDEQSKMRDRHLRAWRRA
jgi:hypothetical protein